MVGMLDKFRKEAPDKTGDATKTLLSSKCDNGTGVVCTSSAKTTYKVLQDNHIKYTHLCREVLVDWPWRL